jgi:HPt (histidine-containing phosphotransfer) domain-containing protein
MINRQELNENLLNYIDNQQAIEILDLFFSDFEERFRSLHESVASRDYKTLKTITHPLKSNIKIFRDPISTEHIETLDKMALNEVENGLEKTLEKLESSSRQLLEELKALREELS